MTEPTPAVRRELIGLLETDQTRVGDVYRLTKRGLNPDQIAAELSVATSGFVSNNRNVVRVLLEGHIPTGSASARQVASHLRRFAAEPSLSADARGYLAERLEILGRISGVQQSRRRSVRSPGRAGQPASGTSSATGPSLRSRTHDELRDRTKALVEAITEETGVVADDYLRVATSGSPLDELAALVSTFTAGRSFASLSKADRLDLSLEAHTISWARDLPLRDDVVQAARARLSYYGYGVEKERS